MTPTTLAAAILRDVPRYRLIDSPYGPYMGREPSGEWLDRNAVLAALTAALDPAIAEQAREVLEGVTPGPWEASFCPWPEQVGCCPLVGQPRSASHNMLNVAAANTDADIRFIAWCREGVPALLSQNAALRAERDKSMEWAKEQHACADSYASRLTAAEAQIAALTARVEGLTGALREIIDHTHNCERELTEELHKVDFCGESLPLTNARAALSATTEEGK